MFNQVHEPYFIIFVSPELVQERDQEIIVYVCMYVCTFVHPSVCDILVKILKKWSPVKLYIQSEPNFSHR